MRDDVAAYGVGGLADAEAEAVEAHLAGCERCLAYLRWLRPAVDLLPESVRQLEPPASLREGLLDVAREEGAAPVSERSRPEPSGRRRFGWLGAGWRPATAVAALLALIAGGVIGYSVGDQRGSTVVAARPLGSGPSAARVATLERRGGSAKLIVERLPALRGRDVYEMWIARGGVMDPAGTFRLGADRTAEAAVEGSVDGADAVLVTREPAGGSPRPTSPPLLRADLG
jgi:hypothetical protein